jgi:hypothetical protein
MESAGFCQTLALTCKTTRCQTPKHHHADHYKTTELYWLFLKEEKQNNDM